MFVRRPEYPLSQLWSRRTNYNALFTILPAMVLRSIWHLAFSVVTKIIHLQTSLPSFSYISYFSIFWSSQLFRLSVSYTRTPCAFIFIFIQISKIFSNWRRISIILRPLTAVSVSPCYEKYTNLSVLRSLRK